MKNEPLPSDEVVEEAVDGARTIEEYETLKSHILRNRDHTTHNGRVTVVRASLAVPEGGDVIDKIRGGNIEWDESYLNQPCSHVDDDPHTYDRISLERRVVHEGRALGTASIIYSETTETTPDGIERLVVEKMERYIQQTPQGALTGERYVRVASPSGEVLDFHHRRARAPFTKD